MNVLRPALFLTLALLAPLPVLAQTPPTPQQKVAIDATALRRTLSLPTVDFSYYVRFSARNGFYVQVAGDDKSAEMGALEKRMLAGTLDGKGFARLSNLYAESGEEGKGEVAAKQGVERFTTEIKAKPTDAVPVAGRARLRLFLNDGATAEGELRAFLAKNPKAWQAMLVMNEVMWDKATRGLVEKQAIADLQTAVQVIGSRKVPAEKIALVEKNLAESDVWLEKAVAVAPKESTVYLSRASSTLSKVTCWKPLLAALKAGTPLASALNQTQMVQATFSEPIRADLWRAADFSNDSPLAYTVATTWEVLSGTQKDDGSFREPSSAVEGLTENERRRFEVGMTKLDTMTKGTDATKKAVAARSLAGIYLAIQRYDAAEEYARLSLSANEKDTGAENLLCGALLSKNDTTGLLAFYSGRVAKFPTARNQVVLAKLLERTGKLPAAEAAARKAVQAEQRDFLARLALATILLKADDPKKDEEAGKLLYVVESGRTTGKLDRDTQAAFARAFGVYQAVIGNTRRAESEFRTAQQLDPQSEAGALLAAIGAK